MKTVTMQDQTYTGTDNKFAVVALNPVVVFLVSSFPVFGTGVTSPTDIDTSMNLSWSSEALRRITVLT